MPIAILPDIDEQRCIGCALCVEICTALGPDVLRVKPVEGRVEEGQGVRLLSRKVHFRRRLSRRLPTHAIFWMRPMEYTSGQPVPLHKNGVFDKGWEEG